MGTIFDYDWFTGPAFGKQKQEARERCAKKKFPDLTPEQATDDPEYQAEEFEKYESARDSRNLKMWFLAAAIFYSMFDAYVDAQLSDFEQTDKAFEVYLGPGQMNDLEVSLTFYIE